MLTGTGRQDQAEATSATDGALQLDPAAERVRKLVGDREPEPRSAAVARPEGAEDPLRLFGRDAGTRVRDGHGHATVDRIELDVDATAVGRPAKGVGEQVRDDLEYP